MLDLTSFEGHSMPGCRKTVATIVLLLAPAWSLAADLRTPTPGELDARIARLIEQLGDAEYPVRQRAQQELIALGRDAFDALCEAESHSDPEIAMQAAYLVRMVRVDWTDPDDPPQVQMIFRDYEAQNDERRLARIQQLADLSDGQGLVWLCRLVRFEKSPVLSKDAALAIVRQEAPASGPGWTQRVETITKAMDRSRRPAAAWLLSYVKAHDDPAAALTAWAAIAEAEKHTLEEHPQETAGRIVIDLLRYQVDLLDRLGREGETAAVLRQMVECERGDSQSLGELVNYLAERKAWTVLDEVATRFAASFELDAMLLYALSEARLAQGNRQAAEDSAAKALKLGGDNAIDHLLVVEQLMDRGLTQWSDRELRHVIATSPVASPAALNARLILSESLHDRQLDNEAGDVIKALIEAVDADPNVLRQVQMLLQPKDRDVRFLRARMHFFFACQAANQKDPAAERKHLDQAIEQEPTDLDVLIALYRVKDDDPARRAKVMKLIKSVVETCRNEIEDMPDEPVNYNELAWLVANTEGDFDEAIRFSQKSVELARSEATTASDFKHVGQYLDTLAHCYFAKKDYANAVKHQSEAVKLDPHTKAISRQYQVFRDALAKSQAEAK
jgi:tetratricopeptide (TPR) repeat protein